MDPATEFAQLQWDFVDPIQRRYEVIRPLVLFAEGTAAQRAQDTHYHPDTVRRWLHDFRQHGRLGLLPAALQVEQRRRGPSVSEAVRQEIDRLKALYGGFHARELVRILFLTLGERIDHKTAQRLWRDSPVVPQERLPLRTVASSTDTYQMRLQVIQLYYQGWDKVSISRFLHLARTTIDRWIARFEAEPLAGLVDHKRGPKGSSRKVWFPRMVHIYHLQKVHPDAGEFRIGSLLAQPDISVRTVGRIMALNKLVYEDIPHHPRTTRPPAPQPHPYKATRRHQYWFIDGRQMDFALDGVKWWSLLILEGYSRTILAGTLAPTEATWAALMVLYTACQHYGAPECWLSDSGGAYISDDFEAVCTRLQIDHTTLVSTQGESYLHWIETHFNIQRRLYDYQVALTRTPAELEQRHQAFIQTYNTTAHQGLLKDQRFPPIPVAVLGEAKGRLYAQDDRLRKFVHAVFPRTTNQYGCVTLHSYRFYVEEGLPQTRVLLWVYGDQLRAMWDDVVLAEYHCHYAWQDRKVTALSDGIFYATRFVSPQGSLIPVTPQTSLVLYRPSAPRAPHPVPAPARQLLLFEVVATA
jgi:transposase InsO family protein